MFTYIIAAILSATPARAGGWESLTVTTQEGDTLLVEKKGRASFKLELSAADKADGIKCSKFYDQMRTPFGLSLSAAGAQAQGSAQMGSIIPYATSIAAMHRDPNNVMIMAMGVCAVGLDVLPGSVVLTLGSIAKAQGRTATLSAEDAALVGDFLK